MATPRPAAAPTKKAPAKHKSKRQQRREEGLRCPYCGSHDVAVQVVQTNAKTKSKNKGIGLGGHVNNAARGVAAVGTLGLSNLVWKKSEGTGKSSVKYKNETVCVCQHCGETFSRRRGMR